MRSSIWIVSLLSTAVLAAPDYLPIMSGNLDALEQYFQLLGSKIQAAKLLSKAPVCDLSKAVMPSSTSPLPPPSAGLTLKHVAIGRGTQNYTCGSNATAPPSPNGAKALLFNSSCIASMYPDILSRLPGVALQFNTDNQIPNPAGLGLSGQHFFPSATTPFFDLNTAAMQLGQMPCAKNSSVPAPPGSIPGQGNTGNGAVAWLKLLARDGATGGLQEVYRLNTAGGSPPATCSGMPAEFQVEYAAEYWFWQS